MSKSFKVQIWFGRQKTDLIVTASNNAHAITIARKVYPNGRVISAQEVK